MMKMNKKYEIIGSSSSGNAVIYVDEILVDVGLSYQKIKPHLENVKLILLTHRHSDHFNPTTLKMISQEFPNIVLCIPDHMIDLVSELRLLLPTYVLSSGRKYAFPGQLVIESFNLFHDVPNVGYKIHKGNYKIVHATDTGSISHVIAKNYDLYAIEHNYDEEIIKEDIAKKLQDGVFSHEVRSKEYHLSFQKASEWIKSMKKDTSEVILLHIGSSYTE